MNAEFVRAPTRIPLPGRVADIAIGPDHIIALIDPSEGNDAADDNNDEPMKTC